MLDSQCSEQALCLGASVAAEVQESLHQLCYFQKGTLSRKLLTKKTRAL